MTKPCAFTIANMAVRRERNDKDMIIVIIGDRGSGKSTLGLKILDSYLTIKKEMGLIDKISWKHYFKHNYAITTPDAIKKYKNLESGSFLAIDEGGDVAYSGDAMTKLSKELIKLVAKIREKRIFTVICLPYKEMLSKKLLKMTHNLIVVPYRYEKLWAYAFVYSKSNNVFLEGDGYGIDRVKKMLESGMKYDYNMDRRKVIYRGEEISELYPKFVFRKLARIPSFKMMFRFKDVNPQLRAMYLKYVKNKLISGQANFELVPKSKFDQLNWKYETLIWNLYMKGGLKKAQIERAHYDKFGNKLSGTHQINQILDRMSVLDQRPVQDE